MPIKEPGIYTDTATRKEYHLDPCPEPSLSRSVAKTIATRTPRHAWFQHPKLNPDYEELPNETFDLGTAAHTLLLTHGSEVVVLDYDDWRKKEAKFERDTLRDQGKTVLLRDQFDRAEGMANAVRAQLRQFGLQDILNEELGQTEVVAACKDQTAGWMRCMFDILMKDLRAFDLKTTAVELNAETVARHCAQMGYEFQFAFYERVLLTLFPELEGRFDFTFIFVENKEPHAVLPVRFPNDAIAKGRAMVNEACLRWAAAKRDRDWPYFTGGIQTMEYPAWSVAEFA